ncbi:MAG TPA: bile acid:sodium symporter family protein [Limnobacter sp.]|nr:bile acid:sodium symporter family protein [Limnobacter sp.]
MLGNSFITIGLPVSLFIIMVGMGLSLTVDDFRRVKQQPRGVVVGTLLQLVAIPALGFAIGGAIGGGVLAAGIVLVAAMPGGTTSNVLTYLAKANLALSITLTVIASLLTVLTIPFYMAYALQWFLGDSTQLELPFIKTLVTMMVIVIIPVALGMFIRAKRPELSQKFEPAINKFAMFVLIAIIVLIMVSERDSILSWFEQAWLPVVLMNVGAVAIGMLGGRLTGLSKQDSLTVSIEMCVKNSTLGLTIALSLLQSAEMALPVAVYGLLMYITVGLLCWYGRRIAR